MQALGWANQLMANLAIQMEKTMKHEEWKKERLKCLKREAERLIEKINEADNDYDLGLWQSKRFAAVKRASLDLNEEGVKLRAGFCKSNKQHEGC